ncbi:MAG: hypothetical protein Q9M97_03445 [Candidatus Gracilibacteria bacterium]|nr:hypothetical protein [Candidatus Gracilibacteria bacterium]
MTAFQTVKKTWKHLFFWQYPTYLHARVPKLKDKEGKVKMVKLPWVKENEVVLRFFLKQWL